MPKKDTSANVLGMLSTAGAQHRPAPARAELAPTGDAAIVDLPSPDAASSQTAPQAPGQSSPSRGGARRPRAAQDVTTASASPVLVEAVENNAPRTHRLDQATANNLRSGWLEARRRGELTISQQEYAGRIIALGLAAEARRLDE